MEGQHHSPASEAVALSARARQIAESPTLALDSKAKAMLQAGADVINFGVGEPDFPTPDPIGEAAIAAIRAGFTKYTPTPGTLSLRRAVVAKFAQENGLTYTPEQIVVSVGAKHSLYNLFQVLLDPGDEVVLQAPYWVSYPEQIRLAEGVPRIISTRLEDGFKITPEQLEAHIGPRTKVWLINSPSNPTGSVYTRQELAALGEVALRHRLLIISDEIYEHLIYRGRHVSIAALDPELFRRTIVVNGVSKAYSMTGWRIGYLAAPVEVARAVNNLQSQSTSNPTSIAQAAAEAALTMDQAPVEAMRQAFDRRRRRMVAGLRALQGFELAEPEGAFYCFPRVRGLYGREWDGVRVTDADQLAALLLERLHIATVPGSGFGAPDYLRFSYAVADERIEEALRRLADWIGTG